MPKKIINYRTVKRGKSANIPQREELIRNPSYFFQRLDFLPSSLFSVKNELSATNFINNLNDQQKDALENIIDWLRDIFAGEGPEIAIGFFKKNADELVPRISALVTYLQAAGPARMPDGNQAGGSACELFKKEISGELEQVRQETLARLAKAQRKGSRESTKDPAGLGSPAPIRIILSYLLGCIEGLGFGLLARVIIRLHSYYDSADLENIGGGFGDMELTINIPKLAKTLSAHAQLHPVYQVFRLLEYNDQCALLCALFRVGQDSPVKNGGQKAADVLVYFLRKTRQKLPIKEANTIDTSLLYYLKDIGSAEPLISSAIFDDLPAADRKGIYVLYKNFLNSGMKRSAISDEDRRISNAFVFAKEWRSLQK